MRTGEVAAQAGVNVQTLRYYERRGLLPEPQRRESGYRVYGPDAVRTVRFVKRPRARSPPARDREPARAGGGRARPVRPARSPADAKIAELERRIGDLQAMRESLARLAATCSRPRSESWEARLTAVIGGDRWAHERLAGLGADERRGYAAILRGFADGRPAGPAELAGDDRAVASLVRRDLLQRGPDGGVAVASPFSARPTRHRVRIADERGWWAMCEIDALAIPWLLSPRLGLALAALALAGVAIGTTEFVAMGLPPEIARGVGTSVPTAGHVVSAYALGVVVGAPVLAGLGARLLRRTVLVALMAAFTVGNLLRRWPRPTRCLSARASSPGCPYGAYFGVASLVASDLAGPERRGRAVAGCCSG
jgi:DNA-binding transcriptional MerR regulator